jgi:hypothetical protein
MRGEHIVNDILITSLSSTKLVQMKTIRNIGYGCRDQGTDDGAIVTNNKSSVLQISTMQIVYAHKQKKSRYFTASYFHAVKRVPNNYSR